jgi:hypothetical protein
MAKLGCSFLVYAIIGLFLGIPLFIFLLALSPFLAWVFVVAYALFPAAYVIVYHT